MSKWFNSSADPNGLALTLKAGIPAVAAAIVVVARLLGLEIAETEVAQVLEAVLTLTATAMFLVGIARKAYIYIKDRFFTK